MMKSIYGGAGGHDKFGNYTSVLETDGEFNSETSTYDSGLLKVRKWPKYGGGEIVEIWVVAPTIIQRIKAFFTH